MIIDQLFTPKKLTESAPPGDKAERMVRDIKQGYAKDGKLTPKEKGIAFATAWKAHNAGRLDEFAPSGDDDSNGSDPEELLRRMASYWWNGTEKQMSKVENTLAAMGWEIGQDDGYDDGGVFVVRAGDEHGGSYISWPHEDLELNEGRKKKNKKTSRSLGRYFFPGFGYYGSGESGEGGGDGGGGESANPSMAEAAQGHTIEAHGVRGMDRRTWHKTFRNTDQMIAWAEKHDAEIIGTRDLEQARHHNLSPARQDMDEGRRTGEYSRVLRALGLYYPDKFSMEELNTPDWHRVIAYKADVPVEYAGKVINDFTRPYDYNDEWPEDDEQDVTEGSDQQLSVRQLATISDEALDKAYGYGRSSPGNTFGWQANLKSAAYAKHMIDKGVTDIDEIADAIHKGWNVTAKAFVKNPDRFDDTEKLKAAGKLEAKLQQRAKLMNIDYSQLPDDEQEKDRVVARALFQAITGGGEQGVAEGSVNDYFKRRKDEEDRIAGTKAPAKRTPKQTDYEKKRKDQDITEMDKSEPSAGRDTGPRSGPDQYVKPITSKQMQDRALDKLNRAVKDSHKKKDVKESDTLMLKLKRAMVKEGRVKELADDLKTMSDADFMKKYGKAKAAIRKDMSRIDEKLSTSDTLSRPAAGASSSGKAIDDPDIMGSLRSGPKFDRLSKSGGETEVDFRAGLVGGETEVEADPRLMVEPLPDMQKWGGKFATGSAGGDNRFTAPTGWRYVEKGEDPARYGSDTTISGTGTPNWRELAADPKSAPPALDMTAKSKFKFDRATQSQVPTYGSGANPNIDAATRDRARAWAAQQNAPGAALAGAMRSSGTPVATAKNKTDWRTIYNLNKAIIGNDPNRIRPGIKLKMPDGSTYSVQSGDTLSKIAAGQINELSTNKLAQYKTAAAKDAKQADQAGDFKRGDKRFSGIVQATKKQFDNDAKKVDESRAARRALMAQIVKGN